MESIESTSPAAIAAPVDPATLVKPTPQKPSQEARPSRIMNGINSIAKLIGQYRSLDVDKSDSDNDTLSDAQPQTTELTGRHPRAAHFGGTYNTSELSRQSAARLN